MATALKTIAVPEVTPAHADAWHQVVTASMAEDLPGVPPPTRNQSYARLSRPGPGSRLLTWLAYDTGGGRTRPMGAATLRLFDRLGQEHLAETELHVHPDARRRGIGTRLLSAVVDEARSQGRRSLIAEAPASGAADLFCVRNGFRRALTLHHLLLSLEEVHRGWLDELTGADQPGYRTAAWNGTVPDTLADTFAAAKNAMNGMPTGDRDHGALSWDAERVRAVAAVVAGRGDTLLTVAAVHDDESDGTARIAGFTEIVIPGGTAARARQYDTAVVPAHRGHGLGVWLKAHMLRRLHDEYPQVTEVETDNAADNTHMLAVNEQLGFRRQRTSHEYRLTLTERKEPA
ncbi:GNAT family N-acetyltransferase [Streptomyces sp. TRM S81-3]|uniref:GNAT family N-acetyltransferase n=1 Tax=Streptomyces griseicoloratus TaxID=2752516 RepID=A0A926QS90_9ACTN|nr:GNAT family N-acetyltransferase [Streptomyces griseicoloratus]MBD0422739.1 GNAT family N-acetyltransferase [Streptomyces griseicoloratus]